MAIGCERRSSLSCRYHGWTYGLDGQLLRAPEMDGVRGFDPGSVRLPAVRVEAWGPLVFVCLSDETPPLSAELAGIADDTRELGLERVRHVEHRQYSVRCNWKVYVDNYLEGYHLPLVHPGLHRELDYARYRVESRGSYSIQHAPFRGVREGDEERRYVAGSAQYYWVFPNLMLNCYLGQLQTNRVVPLGVDQTLIEFDWFAEDAPSSEFRRLVEFSDEIQRQDERICEAVQRGLASASYERGRFSVAREVGVHHFHRLWQERVRGISTRP
jgi:choline monooxygenase